MTNIHQDETYTSKEFLGEEHENNNEAQKGLPSGLMVMRCLSRQAIIEERQEFRWLVKKTLGRVCGMEALKATRVMGIMGSL